MNSILEQAKTLQDWSIKHRRHLHQHPEISGQEKQTSEYCQKILKELGYQITLYPDYGFIADLDIPNTHKKIAFRADMDALPAEEKNTHDYLSKNSEAAHLCGHDAHMAIALTAANLFMKNREKLHNSIRFIFQPYEEVTPGGALSMIKQGCLNDIDVIYGLHNDPSLPTGTIATRAGVLTAHAQIFHATIKGKSGHAARPETGLNPIPAMNRILNDWQLDLIPNIKPAIFNITTLEAKQAINIIPETANFSGLLRLFDHETEKKIKTYIQNSFESLKKENYHFHYEYDISYPSIINTQENVHQLLTVAKNILKKQNIIDNIEPVAWSEDFSYYLQKIPGAFFLLGSSDPKKKVKSALHACDFDIDENCLSIGAAIFAALGLATI